jgi:hypothetical protein
LNPHHTGDITRKSPFFLNATVQSERLKCFRKPFFQELRRQIEMTRLIQEKLHIKYLPEASSDIPRALTKNFYTIPLFRSISLVFFVRLAQPSNKRAYVNQQVKNKRVF